MTNERIDQNKINLVGRLGENWYTKAFGEALFEVAKPLTTLGIGIDKLPEYIRKSDVFTGNDLGMLGNIEKFPSISEALKFVEEEGLQDYLLNHSKNNKLEKDFYIHNLAKKYLSFNNVEGSLKILVAAYV
jgi:hypothetical protein